MNMTQKFVRSLAVVGLTAGLMMGSAAQAVTVTVDQSTGPWAGFMNVSELPANGGAFVFGNGWAVPDLVATFDDGAGTLTVSPNTIGDPNEFWYQNTSGTAPDPINPGGPGQAGNKSMDAVLFIQDDALSGQTVTFEGTVLSNSFTAAHTATIFIRDFAPDFSSVVETTVAVTPGPFSITAITDPTPGRHIQYGINTVGVNVWAGDEGPFGTAVLGTVPEPASMALMGLGGLAMLRRKH